MVRHVLESALPIVGIEVLVSKPGISVVKGAAPCAFGHVIVEVHVNALIRELCSYGIEHLQH
jgi:hypothetical protein